MGNKLKYTWIFLDLPIICVQPRHYKCMTIYMAKPNRESHLDRYSWLSETKHWGWYRQGHKIPFPGRYYNGEIRHPNWSHNLSSSRCGRPSTSQLKLLTAQAKRCDSDKLADIDPIYAKSTWIERTLRAVIVSLPVWKRRGRRTFRLTVDLSRLATGSTSVTRATTIGDFELSRYLKGNGNWSLLRPSFMVSMT